MSLPAPRRPCCEEDVLMSAVLPGATHMGLMRRADLMIPLVRGFLG
jgi:hypothetical protein